MQKKIFSKLIKSLLALTLVFGVVNWQGLITKVNAAAGQEPRHDKTLTDNQNGTYTLELTVTGDADTETTTTVNKSNVILVIDTSGSMVQNNAPGTDRTRLAETKTATNTLIDLLLANNKDVTTEDGVSLRDIIEISIVTFAGTQNNNTYGYLTTHVSPSVNSTYQNNRTQLHGVVNGLNAVGGTNWAAALARANSVANEYKTAQPNESVSVIFLTDGVPTMPGANGTTGGQETRDNTHYAWTDARDDARALVTNKYTLYNIFAFGTDRQKYNNDGGRTDADYLRALTNYAYGTTNTSYTNTTLTDAARPYFFNASDSASLAKAFETIASSISSTAGIAEVGIADGTTNQVKKTSGDIAELLEVDETSYKYWMAWNVNSNGSFEMTINNVKKTYTASQNGSNVVISWTDGETTKTATYPGTVNNGKVKIQWDKATDFYNVVPPTATFNNGSVDWDLKSAGVLLDNVTYSYSFIVYPSEYTLDLIADLENGTKKWSELDANERKYLLAADAEGNGPYTLKTNTGATMTYTDTRTGETKTIEYDDPKPTPVSAQKMDLQKKWAGSYKLEDGSLEEQQPVTFKVLRDNSDENAEEITLTYNADPDLSYKGSIYIANGLMVVDPEAGTVDVKIKGHDYQLQEPKGLSYHWELDADILHPMFVNGKQEMLRLLEDSEVPEGMASTANYYKDGDDVYYRIDGKVYHSSGSDAALTATNVRRSNLNLTKKVQGKDAPLDSLFTFKLKVNSANGFDGKPEDLWFSVWTGEETFVELEVEGATAELDDDGKRTGYFSVSSGTEFTVKMQPDWNLRFTNVLTGSTYEFEEIDMPAGFEFVKVECNIDEEGTEKDPVIAGQKISGTVVQGDTSYVATFTNKFEFAIVAPEVTKVLSVPEGVTGPADITGWYTFTLVEATGKKMKIAADEATVVELNKLTPTDGKVTYEGVEYTKISDTLYYYEATSLTVTNPDKDGGTAAFNKLLFNEADTYTYTVTEAKSADKAADAAKIKDDADAATGKTVTVTVTAAEDGSLTASATAVTFTNKYEPETIDVSVEKVWEDDNNRDNIQPTSVSVTLSGDNGYSDTQTLNATGEWKYTWEDLLKYASYADEVADDSIVYTITEATTTVITGTDGEKTYAYAVTGDAENGFTVTNTHTPVVITVKATKVWDDNNDQDGKRPANITLRLYVGETPVEGQEAKTIAKDATGDALTVSWTNLPKYDQGEEIAYTVKEDTVASYETTITGDKTTGFTVTNKHVPDTTERTVVKVWNDNEDQDKLRPTKLSVQLMNGTTVVTTVELNEENKWTKEVTGLPVYANGQEITYTWKEAEISGYTAEEAKVSEDGKVTTLTNTHTPKTTSIAVEKTWSDANDQDGLRASAKATVTLYKVVDGKEVLVEKDQDGKAIIPVAVPTENGTVTTWINLPVYENGVPIVYKVVETMEGTGYEATYDPSTQTIEAADKELSGTVKVTNTHVPAVQELTGTKVWDDASDQDGIRPANVVITVTGKIEGKEDAVYTKEVTVTAGETPSDTWTWTITDAPVNAEGKPITYSVDEKVVPEGYEKSVSGMTVTNKHTTEKTEASVLKVWDDSENQDGKRPASLTVALLANGEPAKDADGKAITVTLNAENKWTAKVENLEKNAGGEAITYSWSEDQTVLPEGYTLTGNTTKDTLTTLTNSYETEETQATVKKVWVDDNNRDGIQPASLTVALLADGEAAKDAEGKAITVTLNADNEWTAKVEHLDKFAEGKEIEYTWDEGTVTGYTLTTKKEGTITTLTNTHEPEKTSVSGLKTWTDNDDQDGIRPTKIIVYLLADGTKVQTLEVTPDEDGNWAYEFTGLNKNEAGKEITYTVEEEAVAGYTTTYSGNNIINTHTPDETTIEVIKNWDDSNNQDGKRSGVVAEVTLIKTVDGKETEIETVTVGAEDNWSKKWEKLPVNEGGKKITYSVKETLKTANGYTSDTTEAVEVANGGSKTIKNSYTPEVITLTVEKVWNDSDNNDGKRPADITVALLSDGTQIKQLTLNEQNKWLETVEGLPKYKAGEVGKEITYTLKEMVVTDYETTYSDIVDGKITITNTHEKELINIPVEKIWEGDEAYQEYRPEKITVVLVADGKETNMKVELNKDNGWKNSFKDIEKYSAGKEIDYTVKEIDVPAHYKAGKPVGNKTEGYRITNTFAPILFDPPVVKTIIGDKNDTSATFEFEMVAVTEGAPMPAGAADGKITITLPADGKPYEFGEVLITEVGKYEYIIREVAGTDDHYAYDATEYHLLFDVDVNAENELVCQLIVSDGETETIVPWKELSGFPFEFENEYRDYVTLEIEKVWDDGNDAQKLRPEEIEVEVLANGEVIFTVVLNEENEWKYEEVLPYSDDNFKPVTYSVNEKKVPEGYTVSYSQNEYKFTVTNTVTPPETSDASGISMWLAMFGLSVTNSLGLAYVSLKRKKEEQF